MFLRSSLEFLVGTSVLSQLSNFPAVTLKKKKLKKKSNQKTVVKEVSVVYHLVLLHQSEVLKLTVKWYFKALATEPPN